MEENQGTKSSVEMFDLETGIGEEGLSDQVVVINDVEIETEQDLTLQNTHLGSTDTRPVQEEVTQTGGDFIEENNIDEMQRLKISVDEDALQAAAEDGKFAAIPLDLSTYATEGTERIVIRDLPEGAQASIGEIQEDGTLVIDGGNVENLVILVDTSVVTTVELHVEVIPEGHPLHADELEDVITFDDEQRGGHNENVHIDGETAFSMNEDGTINISESELLANASDREGDALSVSDLEADDGTLVNNGDGTWTFTPDENFNGEVDLTYQVSDGEHARTVTAQGTITVESVNDGPEVSGEASFTLNEDGNIVLSEADLLANTSDVEGDNLSVVDSSVSADGGTLVSNGDGTWTFTPDTDFNGEINVSYDVSDGTDTTSTNANVTVEAVNDGPVAGDATSFSMDEDGATITITEEQLLANATDVDGDSLSVANVTADGGTLTDNGDGTWSFDPDADFNGDINLSYNVSDGTDTVATTGTIDVASVNDAAVVGGDTSFTMNEDGTITISQDELLANSQDVDGDTLSVQNLSVDGGELGNNGDGTWTFTPSDDFNGEVNLSYDVSDGTTTTAASSTITVDAVNDGPTAGEATSFTMNEDGTITISEAQLTANASDIDGDSLSASNVSAEGGTLTDNGDGTWTFEPDADFNGDINLSYDVSDGTETVATTGSITVEAVNDGPEVSGNTSFLMNEDGTITITETQLLAKADDIDGDDLSVENFSVSGGDLADNGDGTWTFTPDADFNGNIDLSYDVSDGTTSTSAGGSITVTAVDETNEAADAGAATSFNVDEDGTIVISEADLLVNASDAEGDSLSVVNLSAEDGTLTDNSNGTWSFTPDENFSGDIDVSYDISDGNTLTPSSGTITVDAVNDGPDVSADTSFTMNEDGTISISEDDLLANSSDVEGDDLSATNLSVDGGTLEGNADDGWTFTPDADFNGEINVSYDVSDGTDTTSASGSITVEAVNDAADVSGDTSFTMNEDGSVTLTESALLENSSDVDGDDLSVSNVSADGGTLTDNEDGTWTFEPDSDFNGDINLSYDVSDGTTTTAANGTVTVEAVNDGPEVSGETSFTVNEDGSVSFTDTDLLSNTSDVEGDDLSVSNVSVDGGTLSDDGNGNYTFTPDGDFNGNIDLSYDVSDGTDTVSTGGSITVEAVNDGPTAGDATSFSMNEDRTITITEDQLTTNASDIDGDNLTVTNLSSDGGTIEDNGDGTWSFTPDDDFNGDINLSYDVSDGTETVATSGTVTVDAVNDGPTQGDDVSFTMDEDTLMSITEAELLANASDVDGDTLSVSNLSSDNGTLTDNGDGTWSFDPGADFNGSVDLSYDISDGTTTTSADASITVDDVAESRRGRRGGKGHRDDSSGGGKGHRDDSSGGGKGGKGGKDDSSGGGKGHRDDSSGGGKGGKGGKGDSSGGGKDNDIKGGKGDDDIDGTDANDSINAKDGNDTVDAGAGNDTVEGGKGDDELSGGSGNDEISGGDGNDLIIGGAGDDDLSGGAGDDIFNFGEGSGSDSVEGGEGWMDTVYLENEDGSAVTNTDDWTLELDNGSIEEQADGYIQLSDDAEGTITFSDGSELTFDGIERFEW